MSYVAQPLWWQDFSVFFFILQISIFANIPPAIINHEYLMIIQLCYINVSCSYGNVVVSVINKFALVFFPSERSCKKKLSQSLLMSAYEWVIRLQTLNNTSCNHVYSIEPLHKVIYHKYYKHWNESCTVFGLIGPSRQH